MHRLLFALLALAGTLLATPIANAQELWGGLKAGMTVEQVQAAYPEAKHEEVKPYHNGKPNVHSAVLAKKGLTYVNRPYLARFQFKTQQGLVAVVLNQDFKISRKGEALEVAQSLLTSLRQKYGQEINVVLNRRLEFMLENEWTWVQGDTSIVLSTVEMEMGSMVMGGAAVTYSPGAKKDASKL